MTPTELTQLKPGHPYHVKMKGHRWQIRVFKHLERRFFHHPVRGLYVSCAKTSDRRNHREGRAPVHRPIGSARRVEHPTL